MIIDEAMCRKTNLTYFGCKVGQRDLALFSVSCSGRIRLGNR